jgi:hypothetical protein
MNDIRLTSDLRRDGFSPDDIARICRDGGLARVRRGAYGPPIQPGMQAEDRHLQLIMGTVPQLRGAAVLSHGSAAVVHGLPTWTRALDRVHITRPRAGGGAIRGVVAVHASPLRESEISEVHGLRVTSLERTVADLGRTLPIEQAVAAADRAVCGGLDVDELQRVLSRQRGWPGVPRARQVGRLLDGLAESPGESVSRVRCWQAGLAAPTLQYVVRRDGVEIARCDFGWEEQRTLGEFDGKIKYGRLLRPGETAQDVVYREKLREDALRDQGWQVVRWTWSELYQPGVVADRIRRAFDRSRVRIA